MTSASGRFSLVYNGEVCNAPALAQDLRQRGWRPRGKSDTEVLLASFELLGVEESIQRFAGMFAFALHDRHSHLLHLVRDRLGIKPLHWAWVPAPQGRIFAFASELRALLEVSGFRRLIDPAAAASMLTLGCVSGHGCIWKDAHKLPPAHHLTLDLASGTVSTRLWWNAIEIAQRGVSESSMRSDTETVEYGADLLSRVVAEHALADVPVGCMLSGGIDSAAVAASVLSTPGPGTLAAFTMGFPDGTFDERARARWTAEALGIALHEVIADDRSITDAALAISQVHDEPFGDSSQLPTWLMCREMRHHVKVALTGDGGDEVFGGYRRHVHAASGWPLGRRIPQSLRSLISGGAMVLSPNAWTSIGRRIGPLLPRRFCSRSSGESLYKWSRCLAARTEAEAYGEITRLSLMSGRPVDGWWRDADASRLPDFLRRMQFMDQTGYLADDVLVKVDRCSMAHGLEVRVPLLDHRIVEFGWSLPPSMKVRHGRGKWLLRRILARRIPGHDTDAPKTGFAGPVGRWLRGPLRAWGSDLMSTHRLRNDPMLDADRAVRAWTSVQRGSDSAQHAVWCILMYLAWAERWKGSS
jgi:asparagine synthase (glutamine-hydrolysing)